MMFLAFVLYSLLLVTTTVCGVAFAFAGLRSGNWDRSVGGILGCALATTGITLLALAVYLPPAP